jgi:hypothetical protein
MSEGTVRQWHRMLKDDEERRVKPSVMNDELVKSVDQKICKR